MQVHTVTVIFMAWSTKLGIETTVLGLDHAREQQTWTPPHIQIAFTASQNITQ